jgi:hypothetical protein
MRMHFAALVALLACAPALVCAPAVAQQTAQPSGARGRSTAPAARPVPTYRVELVIFRATSALGSPEDWAAEAGGAEPAPSTDSEPGGAGAPGAAASPGAAVSPGATTGAGATASSDTSTALTAGGAPAAAERPAPAPPSTPVEGVHPLPASDFQMDGVVARLRASGRYVPIAHVAWSQEASPWGKPVRIPVQSVGVDAQGLSGTVALERGQFLHLALDLRYAMDSPPAGLDAPPGTVFVLDESHRVRFKERNYFDHPAFGVIALVLPDRASRRE